MKCVKCGHEFDEVTRKVKLKVVLLTEQDEEFIQESNNIEREYSQLAFDDACEAYRWAYKHTNDVMNIIYIKKIHRIIMNNLNHRISGKIRKVQVGVMTKKGFKEAMHWSEIREELRLLCSPDIYPTLSESLIKRWHIQFEKIHPFEDGNGRVGRILMNIQRLKIGLPILIIHEGKEQMEYYKWFRGNR